MKASRLSIIAGVLAATLTYRDCWWSHGHRICAHRCE
jgi:hypothetical protein